MGPGGAADEEKKHPEKETLNERFQDKLEPPKKLNPGQSYNVENLTITVKDPCDQRQHCVTTKSDEIKLKVGVIQESHKKLTIWEPACTSVVSL